MESNYYDRIDPEEIIDKLKRILNKIQSRRQLEVKDEKECSYPYSD